MAPRGGGQTYGFPIYCASWLPLAHIIKPSPSAVDVADANASPSFPPPPPMVVLGGGGGEGRSGVPNALVVAALDPAAAGAPPALSPEPVFRLGTEEEVPYRMAVHPRGDGVLCSFPNGCRLVRLESTEGDDPCSLVLRSDQEALVKLNDVGLQLALSFSGEGSVLATGGEDGHLRVFKWPGMETVIEEPGSKSSVKDLSFSSDEKFLVVNRSSGPSRVWDLKSSEAVANLPREEGEIFGFCRFSTKSNNSQILFVTAMQGVHGKIISWNTTSWTRIGSKKVTRDAISAFSVSPDGTLLAIGTIEGSISVLGSRDMRVVVTVKKAHLGIVTTLAFSQDSRALLSTSFDSTARVTSTESPKSDGISLWSMILAIILAILVYYYMQHKEDLLGVLPQ
ncbi:SEC12-like protein 2 [Hordeum vulgare]|uniref:Anaphase-promoting complex subunit 4 WD40 domain-containing protein n=2 Tax=Hordeum vulgare subsp. vulgare TaxID=112509 RepID=A0A8I6YG23_HORVV|nr:SEC12-like protein 2 [Hordeum vulgare subsp. vulgare]KAE8784004.1 SEC12-like protein 2 [Hordeum vulgare]